MRSTTGTPWGTPGARLSRRACLRRLTAAGPGVVAVAACGRETEPPGAAPAKEPVTVEYAYATDPGVDVVYLQVFERFQAAQPAIKVRPLHIVGEDPTTKVLTLTAAGTPPDGSYFLPRWYHEFRSRGMLRELDSFIAKDRAFAAPDFYAGQLEYTQFERKQYGVPYISAATLVYFNAELFGRAGARTPAQLEREGRWTFDTFLDAARALSSGAGAERIFGGAIQATILDFYAGFIWPFGGDLWTQDLKRTLLDSRDSLAGLQWVADLHTRHLAAPIPPEISALGGRTPGGFASGRVGMVVLARTFVPTLSDVSFPLGMAPMPRGRAGRHVRFISHNAGVFQASQHPQEAWELVKSFTLQEGQEAFLAVRTTDPVRKSLGQSREYQQFLASWEDAEAYRTTYQAQRVFPYPVRFLDINAGFVAAWNTRVLTGEQGVQEAVTGLLPQINALLQ
jgi:multiple sugar transport system substrate-binding protein